MTKARDAVESFGYSGMGSRTSATFVDGISAEAIAAMAGLPAAREAIRDGAPVAYWRAGITHTANPSGSLEPQPGDFSVRLGPRAELLEFATGYATDAGITHADKAKATSIGLEAIRKAFGIDASTHELEFVERTFPAGKTELTWHSPTPRYGHVEQLRVILQGDRLILIERSFEKPRGYKAPSRPILIRVFTAVGPVVIGGVFVIGCGLDSTTSTQTFSSLSANGTTSDVPSNLPRYCCPY